MSLKLLEPSGPVQACNGIALPFFGVPVLQRAFFAVWSHSHVKQLGDHSDKHVVLPVQIAGRRSTCEQECALDKWSLCSSNIHEVTEHLPQFMSYPAGHN